MAVVTVGIPIFSGGPDDDVERHVELFKGHISALGINANDLAGNPTGESRTRGLFRASLASGSFGGCRFIQFRYCLMPNCCSMMIRLLFNTVYYVNQHETMLYLYIYISIFMLFDTECSSTCMLYSLMPFVDMNKCKMLFY